MASCPFCDVAPEQWIASTASPVAVRDKYPVTLGHTLIIPKAHRTDFFSLSGNEPAELWQLLHEVKKSLLHGDRTITGFNIGMNCGASAGQTVFHCHVHLIPRRDGDAADPRGGVRGVIPERQKY